MHKRLRIDQRICPHCNRLLSFKTFRTHKRLYYDEVKDAWHKLVPDSNVGDEGEECPPSLMEECSSSASSPCSDCDLSFFDDDSSPSHSDAAFSDREG